MEELSTDDIESLEEKRLKQLADSEIDEEKVLQNAKTDIGAWNTYFNENITRGKDDMNFVLRDQWTATERSEFYRLFKPAMTFNKLYDVTKKIIGEQRRNKPDLQVRSLSGIAKQSEIDLRTDLVRTISYQSQNDLVYQQAFKSALMMGYGAFQVCIDYETPTSFNEVIRFDLIQDATRCAFDPIAIKPHKGDGNFCSRIYVYSKEEFEATYPYIQNPVSYTDQRYLIDLNWQSKNFILVCHYFKKEWYSIIVYKLSNGMSVTADEWDRMQKQYKEQAKLMDGSPVVKDMLEAEMPHIVMERQAQDYKIMHYQLLQNQIIDFQEWPSKHLPIIFDDGDSNFIEGQQYTKSFVHEAKDAQRFVNYVGSEIAAEIKNRRREQWLATPDNIKGNEQMWRNAELQQGALIATPDPKTGQMPIKQNPWEMSQSLLQQYQRGTQDIREITGYSEAEEIQSRDISGKAKRERKLEVGMSSYIYFDNLNQAIEQAGRVVLDLLPVVYGQDNRYVNLLQKDGKTKPIVLNQLTEDGSVSNPLTKGDFDIEISTGPSFAVQQETSLQFFTQLISANPGVFPLIGDLYAKNLDIQHMSQVAERLESLVPPEILAKERGEQPPPPQPNPQQMMLEAQIKMKAQELKLKEEKLQLEKQQLMLDAEKAKAANQLNVFDHASDLAKSKIVHDLDRRKHHDAHNIELTKIIADLHKHHTKT